MVSLDYLYNLQCNSFILDEKVLSELRKVTGDTFYTPSDPKELCNRLFVTCFMSDKKSLPQGDIVKQLSEEIGRYEYLKNVSYYVLVALMHKNVTLVITYQFQQRD